MNAIHAAFLAGAVTLGTASLGFAQSASSVGTGGASAGGGSTSGTIGSGGSAAAGGTSASTLGTGGSSAGNTGMSNSGSNKKTGLDRADQVAGKHGKQGRRNAREHQRD